MDRRGNFRCYLHSSSNYKHNSPKTNTYLQGSEIKYCKIKGKSCPMTCL
jgi:hypothetical protein